MVSIIRDVAIVLLALESIVIGILLALMLVQLRQLVKVLQQRIAPMLDSANQTISTVHGTADFLSKRLVDPVIQVSSVTAGTLQALRNLLSIGRRAKGHAEADWSARPGDEEAA